MIRLETASDLGAIRRVLTAAFPSSAEAELVDGLRSAGDLVLSLVADDGEVVGHIAFSRLGVSELRATALGPIGIRPERQRIGIGSSLVQAGLSRLTQAGEDLVVVLGEAQFYARFGFSREAAAWLKTPYDGPHLLAKALSERGSRAHGEARYAPAFAALG